MFTWETFTRDDRLRVWRKGQQLLVDEMTFCASSAIALALFVRLNNSLTHLELVLVVAGGLLTCVIGVWIWVYADLRADYGADTADSAA